MRTIAERYRLAVRQNSTSGVYCNLSKAIRGMKFGRQNINNYFNKLVPKGDYAKDEKDLLLENLYKVTQSPLPLSFFESEDSPKIPLFLATS